MKNLPILRDNILYRTFQEKEGSKFLVTEKLKNNEYKGYFLDTRNELIAKRYEIVSGRIKDLEKEEQEFCKKTYLQKNKDKVRIIRKIPNRSIYECTFINYPYVLYKSKSDIKRGCCYNPRIEESVIGKIIEQQDKEFYYIIDLERKSANIYYIGYFISAPNTICSILKRTVLAGKAINYKKASTQKSKSVSSQAYTLKKNSTSTPYISVLVGRTIHERCGDDLYVKEQFYKEGKLYFRCEFKKYPYKIEVSREELSKNNIDNPKLPFYSKEGYEEFFKKYFPSKKPSLTDVYAHFAEEGFKKETSEIYQEIEKFGLKDKLDLGIQKNRGDLIEAELDKVFSDYKGTIQKHVKFGEYEARFYFPDLKFALCFDGNYECCSLFRRDNYFQDRLLYFLNKGIQIITLYEWEWNVKKQICINILRSKLGLFERKIYARSCKIELLNPQESGEFLDKYHLQGNTGAKVKIGLKYKGELVEVMTFGAPRFSMDFQWEIIREASKQGVFVLGGKVKIWKYFIKHFLPESVISYCDAAKFLGNSYSEIDMILCSLNKAGFWWYSPKRNVIEWRNPFKHKEKKAEFKGIHISDSGMWRFEYFGTPELYAKYNENRKNLKTITDPNIILQFVAPEKRYKYTAERQIHFNPNNEILTIEQVNAIMGIKSRKK